MLCVMWDVGCDVRQQCVTQRFVSVYQGLARPDKLQLEFFINQTGPLRRLLVVGIVLCVGLGSPGNLQMIISTPVVLYVLSL